MGTSTRFVFTSQDIRLRFEDGGRDGEKSSFTVDLVGADLLLTEHRPTVFHRDRGVLDHRRLGEPEPIDGQLSWRFANRDIADWVRQNLPGVSTAPSAGNLCTEPYDYTTNVWVKNGVTVSDDGLAPDGEMVAQRLTPTSAASKIEYVASLTPELGEWIYVDWWAKAPTDHQAKVEVALSHNGGGPPYLGWVMFYDVTGQWVKHTAGNSFVSSYVTEETVTVRFLPTAGTTEPMDLWEVYIRRGVTEKKTWDLYIDFLRDGVTDHTVMLPGVAYKSMTMEEGEEASIYAMQFDVFGNGVLEV